MRRAVLFDMDGVITDTEKYYVEAMVLALREAGHDVHPDDMNDLYGSTQKLIWTTLIERYNLPGTLEEYVGRVDYLRDCLIETKGLHGMPGVIDLIRNLHEAGVALAVASSAPINLIRSHMRQLGIEECFQAFASGLECKAGKPAPDIFLLAAERLGMKPEECVVIEDSGNGVRAGKAAGMYTHAHVPPQAQKLDVSPADSFLTTFEGVSIEQILGNPWK